MTDSDAAGDPIDEQVLEFTLNSLGPASARQLQKPEVRDSVRQRIDQGADLEDAVLAVIHGFVATRPRVADEFAAYFLLDLMKMGRLSMSSTSRIRRFLDTGDLVLSVFGDLWGDLASLRFESRNQFKTLFAQRMDWKAADQARRLSSQRRREDRRVPQQPEDLDLHELGSAGAPLPHAIRQEEKEQFILILMRLKPRERRLLTLHLKGESIESIGRELGLNYDATRKALSRAIEQARRLARTSLSAR